MSDVARTKLPDEDDILEEARRRFKEAQDADNENRLDALDDVKFAWNYRDYQWPTDIKTLRRGRPCLTENRLPQFIRQIVNTQRMNRPSITVSPLKDGSVDTAQVIEGIIRHVEQWSKADLAYDSAFEWAVTSGVGYFRITTEYVDDTSFDQDICVRPIDNPFAVYDDPYYQLPDASDRRYCFVTEMVDRKEFEDDYGFEATQVDATGPGDYWRDWFTDDKVRVAEYWRVRTVKSTIKAPEPLLPADDKGQNPKTREVAQKVVEQFLMTGDRIIKKSSWLGIYIPIIPVFGEVKNIEGRKVRKSLIRDAKDAQRINNYWLSTETEMVALQPRAPFIGPKGAFDTDEEKWANANAENYAYLEYDGEVPPQRQPPPAFPDAVRETRMASIESMKAIMGIYDASLGARSNETSGIAIEARQQQGDFSTYHFIDNMTRAMRYAGTVIIDLIPKVLDQPRVARIVGPDGSINQVAVNAIFMDPQTNQVKHYNLATGQYDVVVKAGPSWQTRREETARAVAKLMESMPQLGQLAGDILIKNLDFPEADKIAERLDPQLQQQLQQGQQAQQQVQQQQQQMQQMQAAIQQFQQEMQQMQQKNNMQELQLLQKNIQLKDKTQGHGLEERGQNIETGMRFAELLLEYILAQQKQQQSVIQEAQQMQPGMQQIVQ